MKTIGDHAAEYILETDSTKVDDHIAYGWPQELHEIADRAGITDRMKKNGKCSKPGWQREMFQRVLDGIERDMKKHPDRWERFQFRCFVGYTPTGGDLQRGVRAYRLLDYKNTED